MEWKALQNEAPKPSNQLTNPFMNITIQFVQKALPHQAETNNQFN